MMLPPPHRSKFLDRHSRKRSHRPRSGEAIDGLVFLVVALLIPCWLLGHLFLSIYPASNAGGSAAAPLSTLASGFDRLASNGPDAKPSDQPAPDRPTATMDEPANGSVASDGTTGGDTGAIQFPENDQDAGPSDTHVTADQLQELNGQQRQLLSQLESLRNQLAEKDSSISELRDGFSQLQANVAAAAKSNLPADSSLSSPSNDSQSTAAIDSLALKLTALDSDVGRVRESNQKVLRDLASLRQSLESSAAEKPTSEQSVSEEVANQIADNAKRFSDLDTTLDQVQSQLDQLQQRQATMASQIESRIASQVEAQTASRSAESSGSLTTPSNAPGPAMLPPSTSDATIASSSPLEYRDITSSRGNVAKLAFLRWEGDLVVVQAESSGKIYKLRLDRFSPTDQSYFLNLK